MINTYFKNKYLKYKTKYLNKMKGGNPFKYYILFENTDDGQTYQIILPLFDNKLYLTFGLNILIFTKSLFDNLIIEKYLSSINPKCKNLYDISIYTYYDNILSYNLLILHTDKEYKEISNEDFKKKLLECLENEGIFYTKIGIHKRIDLDEEIGHAIFITIRKNKHGNILFVFEKQKYTQIIHNFFKLLSEELIKYVYNTELNLQDKINKFIISKCDNVKCSCELNLFSLTLSYEEIDESNIWMVLYQDILKLDSVHKKQLLSYTDILINNIKNSCETYSSLYLFFIICNPFIEYQILFNYLDYLYTTEPYTIIKLILSYHYFIYTQCLDIIKEKYEDEYKKHTKFNEIFGKFEIFTHVFNPELLGDATIITKMKL